MMNNPILVTRPLLDFMGNNTRLQMLQTLHKAIETGKIDLATDAVSSIRACSVSSKRKINQEGRPYNKYLIEIRKADRVWKAKVCIADLVHFLMLYCPHISYAAIP